MLNFFIYHDIFDMSRYFAPNIYIFFNIRNVGNLIQYLTECRIINC